MAIFGSIYKVGRPTVLAPYAAIGWFIVGLVVAMLVRGRPQASHTVADLGERRSASWPSIHGKSYGPKRVWVKSQREQLAAMDGG